MWPKTNMVYTVIFSTIFLANMLSVAAGPLGDDPNRQELLQDCALVKTLGWTLDLKGLEKLAAELGKKWFPKDKEYYGYMMLEICGAFSSYNFKDERQYELARQYALLALDKSQGLDEDNRIPIEVEFRLLMYVRQGALSSAKYLQILAQKDDWANQRSKESKFYFHAWDRLERAIDPNWDPNDPSLVSPLPPAGIGIYGNGMSPENIEDPKLRAEYKAALDRYWQRSKWHSEQHRSRRIMKENLPILQKHLLMLYSGPLFDSKTLDISALQQDMEKHIKDEKVRTIILDALKERVVEESQPKSKPKLGVCPSNSFKQHFFLSS